MTEGEVYIPQPKAVEEAAKKVVLQHHAKLLAEEWLSAEQFKDFDFTGLDEFYEQQEGPIHFRVGAEHGDTRHGLWPRNGTVLLAAQAKAGKTTLLLNLLHSLVTGEKFLGRFDVEGLSGDDKVSLLNLEVNPDQYRRWLKMRDIPNDPRVSIANLRGMAKNVNLLHDGVRKLFVEKLQKSGANILIVDPIGPIMRALGIEENDSTTVGRLLDAFNELRVDTNVQDIFLVHHSGHAAKDQKDRPGGSRGTSAFNDIPDALWTYRTDEDEGPTARVLSLQGRDVVDGAVAVKFDEPNKRLYSPAFKIVDVDMNTGTGKVQSSRKPSLGRGSK